MLSRELITSLSSNPDVMSEILRTSSTEALLEMWAGAKVDEGHPLDNETLLDNLIAARASSALLVMAQFSQFGGALGSAERILAVANLSHAHKCALLSNPRIYWYRGELLGGEIPGKLLVPVLLANDSSTRAFLRNPRSDRGLIANAIRGVGPFDALSLEVRLSYAIEAARASYVDSPNYPGKDSPDANELEFNEPIEALMAILRIAFNEIPLKRKSVIAFEVMSALTGKFSGKAQYCSAGSFAIQDDDWLSADDRAACEASVGWDERFSKKRRLARERFLAWTEELGAAAQIAPQEGEEYFQGGLGDLATYLSSQALREMNFVLGMAKGDADTLRRTVEAMSTSKSWVHRAAATVFDFETMVGKEYSAAQRVSHASQLIGAKIGDPLPCIRGLATSATFWGLYHSSDTVSSAFQSLRGASPEADRAVAYVCEWIGQYEFRDNRDEAVEREARRSGESYDNAPVPDETQSQAPDDLGARVALLAERIKSLRAAIIWGLGIVGVIALLK